MVKRHFYLHLVLLVSIVVLTGCGPVAFHVELVPTKQQLQETEIYSDSGLFVSGKIAIIDVDGLMINRRRSGWLRAGDNPVSLFLEKLDKAAADSAVKAIVLRIDSPGGTVAACDIMHHSLSEFKQRTGKPVVACVMGMACSGGYYLACGGDEIMAQPSSVVGNIGTIFQTFSVAGTMDKIGVKAVTIKSGDLKDLASPLHDLSDEEREVLDGMIQELYQQFLAVVQEGRRTIGEDKLRGLADGRVFTTSQALHEGLIDKVGYPPDGILRAKKMAGLKKAKVVIYHRALSYKPNAYASAAAQPGGPGALINIDLPDWFTSDGAQFLYLWQPGNN